MANNLREERQHFVKCSDNPWLVGMIILEKLIAQLLPLSALQFIVEVGSRFWPPVRQEAR
jgi:hypothetical protein